MAQKEPNSLETETGSGAPGPGKAQRTRLRLIEATCEELSETGSFTAERVAQRAGTSVATFYVHLPAKDVALAAAFGRVMEELVSVVEGHLQVERLLEQGLEALIRSFVEASIDFFSTRSLVLRCGLAKLPESRELRHVYREHQALAFAHFTRFVSLGQAAGRIRAGSVPLLARTLLVLSQGLNNPLVLDDEVRAQLPGELTRVMVGWLEPVSDPA